MTDDRRHGPLAGVKVIEIASLGPGPFAAMMLADMGADVLRIERPDPAADDFANGSWNVLNRSRPSVHLNLKNPAARAAVIRLAAGAEVLIEGFRPGVMERLGLGPDVLEADNPRLCYARMTGYGQDGPMASAAGHDLNYLSLTGALRAMARHGERPAVPLNLIGDFGGGGMLMAFGIVCAVLEARSSGRGQIIDAAMVDGAALLAANIYALRAADRWNDEPGTNLLDGGAPFYDVYQARCGGYVALGALEPQFYRRLCELIGLEPEPQWDQDSWPEQKERFARLISTRTRREWVELTAGEDTCLTPVLDFHEAPAHPHNQARRTFVNADGVVQPAPAPRFSRTPGQIQCPPAEPGADTDRALRAWGLTDDQIQQLHDSGATGQPPE
ncbi:CaiB/BaiF CoA transferase family protein [Nocardia farcinica]|uniref:CaiB/BaiF CoA transferase family protein n=1 Tax=Nocardia farcinica TaxID=37329 RepID=UPI00378FF884